MKLIVGLGNPGEEYKNNRHNVGHMAIEILKTKNLKDSRLVKTDCFMNTSGKFVKGLVDRYNLDLNNLYIIHDDLDIALGEYKIQFGKGPKDHNGLLDIYNKLGTKEFWHVRIGVDNRETDNRTPGEKYVLQDFSVEEKKIVDNVIQVICKKLAAL